MCRTWSGARGSGMSSPGSISPSSVRADVPPTNAVSWLESQTCTSWDCTSSTLRRPMFSPAWGGTRSTSQSALRRANRAAGRGRTRWSGHAALRHPLTRGPEATTLKAFEALDADGQESPERDLIVLIYRCNRSGDKSGIVGLPGDGDQTTNHDDQ